MARSLGISYTEQEPFYFISYNSEDEERVSAFARKLELLGVPMWYDRGIKVGAEWEIEIAERIENCSAVIMFLSKNIFLKENSYVHKEYELATEYSQKDVYIIMLDQIQKPEVPIRFRSWWTNVTRRQCINTFELESFADCAKLLVESIGIENLNQVLIESPHTEEIEVDVEQNNVVDHHTTAPLPKFHSEWLKVIESLSDLDLMQRAMDVSVWHDEYRTLCKEEYFKRTGVLLEDPIIEKTKEVEAEPMPPMIPASDWDSAISALTDEELIDRIHNEREWRPEYRMLCKEELSHRKSLLEMQNSQQHSMATKPFRNIEEHDDELKIMAESDPTLMKYRKKRKTRMSVKNDLGSVPSPNGAFLRMDENDEELIRMRKQAQKK